MADSQTLKVTPARAEDLSAVLELMRQLSPNNPPVDLANAERTWRQILGGDTTQILIGRLSQKVVSSCMLVIVPNLTRGCRPYAVIENVITHADFRGRGFGHATMRSAADRAKLAGCYKIMLMTGRKEEWVLRFYESCGFERHSKTAFQLRID